ncbi:MAG: tight adherence protein C [Candidatus Poriferisodalaceae bacterium]|jgi:tight adherence protein C
MSLTVYLACFLVAAALPIAWLAASSSGSNPSASARLEAADTNNLRTIALSRTASERLWQPGRRSMAARFRRITPSGLVERLDRRSQLAGIAREWPVDRLLSAKFVLMMFGFLLSAVALTGPVTPRSILGAIAFPVFGFLLPDTLVTRLAAGRQEQIERQLPDAMDQITITVEAGLGLEAAIARIGQKAEGPLPDELNRMMQDIAVGIPRHAAFDRLVERTDVADLRQFVASLRQAESNGIPLARVLRTHADELRERRRQRAEEKAHAMPVKLVFPLLLCILPALFVVIMGPSMIELSRSALFAG